MTTENTTNNAAPVAPAAAPVSAPMAAKPVAPLAAPFGSRGGQAGGRGFGGDSRGGMGRGGRPGGSRPSRDQKERIKPEFDTRIIQIRRVTRVASGGRRFSFSVAVVSGDKKGRVGVGLGKAGDTSLAIDKATRDAKKHMIKVTLSPAMTIPHMVEAKFSSARVMIMPARGRGVVAGSSVRNVIELAGIKDVCAKLMSGSKNKLNNARVAVRALEMLSKYPRSTLAGKAPSAAPKK
jgi:small subunit ribosomal protein S5